MPTPIAVFDFDHTLTERDSLRPFLLHLAGPVGFAGKALLSLPVVAGYFLGWIDDGRAKAALFRRFLGGTPVEPVREQARDFARNRLPDLLRPEAMNRLHWHREQGHRLVLVSASVGLYLRPWAEAEGFDDVVCTELEAKGGRFTGAFDGPNCNGPEKVRRLRAAVPEVDAAEVYAYGDSAGDRELLQMADYAYYRSFDAPAPPSEVHR
jgi:HAD superfamily hydrolase (TIGR01490 family)